MGISCDITKVGTLLDGISGKVETSALDFLKGVGEDMYQTALSTKTYQDRTGYLTSTIRYGVYIGGELVFTGGSDGEGKSDGDALLQSLVSEVGDEPCVRLVAAASYAAITERRGFVVIDGARLAAGDIVKRHISDFAL